MSRLLDFVYAYKFFVLATLWSIYADFIAPAMLAVGQPDGYVFFGLMLGLMLTCVTFIAVEKTLESLRRR